MSDYFIQDKTMRIIADNIKRISGTTDQLNAAEIAEILSRAQGSVKTDGQYLVKAVDIGGETIKSGTYDTGEVFALPSKPKDIKDLITQPDGTREWVTLATFDGWVATTPISSDSFVVVDNMPIDIGALYKPVNDDLIIMIDIAEENVVVTLHIIMPKGAIINWGDGVSETISNITYSHSHTYTNIGYYMIKIPYFNYNAPISSLLAEASNYSAIKSVYIPKWCCGTSGLMNPFAGMDVNYIHLADGIWFHTNSDTGFGHTKYLEHISLPNSITQLTESMFRNSGIKSVVLPYGITSISRFCFYGCNNLKSVTIPDSVTSIGDYAFCDCTGLTSINIPDSVTSISNYAFMDCSGLTSVTMSNNVTSIGDYMFFDCNSLTEVKGLDNVTSIGAHAFGFDMSNYANARLTLILPSVTSIGGEAFNGRSVNGAGFTLILGADIVCSIESNTFHGVGLNYIEVYVPDNLVDSYKSDTNWSTYASKIKPLSEYTGTI